MAHDTQRIRSMAIDATQDQPKLRVTFDNDIDMLLTTGELQRLASDFVDWAMFFDDQLLDRIHRERNAENGI